MARWPKKGNIDFEQLVPLADLKPLEPGPNVSKFEKLLRGRSSDASIAREVAPQSTLMLRGVFPCLPLTLPR